MSSGSGYRLGWGFGATVFQIVVIVLQVTGARPGSTDERFNLEFGFGARLVAWIGFAIAYFVLGLRAFSRCDRAGELVRRVLAKLLAVITEAMWLLAGGGGAGWPVVIAVIAFVTILTALFSRSQASDVVPVLPPAQLSLAGW